MLKEAQEKTYRENYLTHLQNPPRHLWQYTNEELHRFIDKFATKTHRKVEDIHTLFLQGGGKAFSLAVCEEFAKLSPSYLKFKVPYWNLTGKGSINGLQQRSSYLSADWIDYRAGIKPSKDPRHFYQLFEPHSYKWMQIDVFPAKGHGLKNYVRATSGYELNTSDAGAFATCVANPDAIVWYGDNVLTQKLRQNQQSFFTDPTIPEEIRIRFFKYVTEDLPRSMRTLGCNFPMQFEFVYGKFGHFYIVQSRPTPHQIYNHEFPPEEEVKNFGIKEFCTPVVSGACKRESLYATKIEFVPTNGEPLVSIDGQSHITIKEISTYDLSHLALIVTEKDSQYLDMFLSHLLYSKPGAILATQTIANTKHFDNKLDPTIPTENMLRFPTDLPCPVMAFSEDELVNIKKLGIIDVWSNGLVCKITESM